MKGMMTTNRIMFTLGRNAPRLAGTLLSLLMRFSLSSMEQHITNDTSPLPGVSPEIFAIINHDQREAVRQGYRGLAFDLQTIFRRWPFELGEVTGEVFLWHGEADNLAPALPAHFIAEQLPDCKARFYFGEGHIDPFTKHADEIMDKLAEVARLERPNS
jgi:pimeloyl-ACP methyl ester carboxylesterase